MKQNNKSSEAGHRLANQLLTRPGHHWPTVLWHEPLHVSVVAVLLSDNVHGHILESVVLLHMVVIEVAHVHKNTGRRRQWWISAVANHNRHNKLLLWFAVERHFRVQRRLSFALEVAFQAKGLLYLLSSLWCKVKCKRRSVACKQKKKQQNNPYC